MENSEDRYRIERHNRAFVLYDTREQQLVGIFVYKKGAMHVKALLEKMDDLIAKNGGNE